MKRQEQQELDERESLEEASARVKFDEILGIVFITIAVLLFVGWRFEQSGAFHTVAMKLLDSIGAGMWYLILMFAVWGINKFRGRAVISDWIQLASWIALLPVFLGFLQSFQPVNRELGGSIGWTLYTNLEDLAGTFSARVLLAGLALILTVICLDTPLTQLVASGYHAGGKATGFIGPVLLAPITLLASAVYHVLTFVHMLVFIVLKDLVVMFEILYDRVMTIEEAQPGATGEGTLGRMSSPQPARPTPPPAEPARPSAAAAERGTGAVPPSSTDAARPQGDPVVELNRPEPSEGMFVAPRAAEPVTSPEPLPEPAPLPAPPEATEPAFVSKRFETEAPAELFGDSPAPEPAPEPEPEDTAPPPAPEPVEPPAPPALAEDLAVHTLPTPDNPIVPAPGLFGKAVKKAKETAAKISSQPVEYTKPSEDLFLDPPPVIDREDEMTLRSNAEKLVEALAQFRIQASVTRITQGPTITQYEVKPAPGVKISNIVNLSNDIAMAMASAAIRIEAPIPGRSAVGIEIPNRRPTPVTFKELITTDAFRKTESPLAFAIGKDITGRPVIGDLARMPHLLVAGATGSGKSVCINTIISSVLFRARPDEVKFIMIDPKVVELTLYDGIPNLVTEVITDPQDATAALRWAVLEMERRYRYLSKFAARDIRSFNKRLAAGDLKPLDGNTEIPDQPMPYIVVVVDELADLMMLARKEIEDAITRLAQMARAIGIHLVLATQRPSTNIVTGVLKANLPSRIAFSVSSQVDSKVILDTIGAEKLLGSGDMLYSPIGQAKPMRLQGAYISEEEVRNLVAHLKTCGEPEYTNIVEEVMEPESDLAGEGLTDDKFADCVRIAVDNGEASTSMLQRHLKIGYNRAARIIEAMESRGIISGPESGKRRKVLISQAEAQRFMPD